MPKSIRIIFIWGLITLSVSVVAGYFIHNANRIHSIYIMIFLVVYYFASSAYIREKIDMIKVEHEIDLLLKSQQKLREDEDE